MFYYEIPEQNYYIQDLPWQLDVPYWEVDDRTKKLLFAADMMQDRNLSIRKAAEEYCISKSTLHAFIHNELRCVCPELYGLCKRVMKENTYQSRYRLKQYKL